MTASHKIEIKVKCLFGFVWYLLDYFYEAIKDFLRSITCFVIPKCLVRPEIGQNNGFSYVSDYVLCFWLKPQCPSRDSSFTLFKVDSFRP